MSPLYDPFARRWGCRAAFPPTVIEPPRLRGVSKSCDHIRLPHPEQAFAPLSFTLVPRFALMQPPRGVPCPW